MARADPAITSFNGGELSPYVGGRPDVARYATGCRRMFNYLPRVTGAAVRRPGTQYVGVPKNNTAAQLIAFEASTSANTVLELGTGYARFWDAATRLPILNAGGVWGINLGAFPAAELAVNFDYSHPLGTAQSNDVMWICDGSHYPQKLSRIAQYQFQIAQMGDGVNAPGPYKDVSSTQTITLTFGAQSGAGIAVTASAPLFAAKNVGEYWYCQAPKTDSVTPWETAKAITVGMVRTSNGRNYVALTNGTTGTVRPSHSIGARWDGTGASGVQWDYSDDNYGEVLITAVTSATAATCTVITKLPLSVTAGGSTRWARAAWNVDDGYPVAVCFYQGRLCFARGQQVWCSVAGDFENFTTMDAQQTLPDLALNVVLANRKNDRALWMAAMPSANDLIIGTANGAYALSENVSSEAFGPGNARARSIAGAGCAPVPPVTTGNTLVFVQRGGRKVRRVVYDFQSSGYVTPDMTAFASHIASRLPLVPTITPTGQITRLVSTQSPDPVIWAIGSMGGNYFHSLTFDAEQQVEAWATHQLGGVGFTDFDGVTPLGAPQVFDTVSVLSPNLRDDDVWMLTSRFAHQTAGHGGPGKNLKLEVLGPHPCYLDANKTVFSYDEITGPVDAQFLDYASMVTSTPSGVLPAIGIPDGFTASALVNGYTVPDAVVSGAGMPLPPGAGGLSRIGFNFLSILHPMPPLGQSQTGTPWGKRSRIMAVAVRLLKSVGGRLQGSEDADAVFDRVNMRTQSDPMDTATPLKSGDYVIDMPAGYAGGRDDPLQAEIVWIQDQPLPSTVLGLFPQMSVADA